LTALQLVASLLVTLSLLALWLAPRIWSALLALGIAAGYASGQLSGPAAVWIALLAGACYAYTLESPASSPRLVAVRKAASLAGIVTLSVALSLHVLPGFHNLLIHPPTKLTSRSAPYEQWLNFDKTIAGLLILGICYRGLIQTRAQLAEASKRAAIPAAVTILVVVSASVASGFVQWDPKWTGQFWIWGSLNLLSTCMSEEAFFRGFVQSEIARHLGSRRGALPAAIGCSATLFGIAHIAGGWGYAGLASVAGAGYAIVFHRSKRIEMSMLTHFGLNTVHFLLFTYPTIAPSP
jgi:membrane protease YdiL (CAAX protease family)